MMRGGYRGEECSGVALRAPNRKRFPTQNGPTDQPLRNVRTLDGIADHRQRILMKTGWMNGRTLAECAWGLLLSVQPGWAAPIDYAIPPPALNLFDLNLPSVAPSATEPSPASEATARALRDEAIRDFQAQHYQEACVKLDRLSTQVALTPNLQRLHAWAATYANLDERGAELWSQLAATTTNETDSYLRAGWHYLRLNRAREASLQFAQALRLEPQQSRTLLMMGLGAWAEGRYATAQRHLVQAMRAENPSPECAVSMAALQADQGYFPECAGWLRRILPTLPGDERIRWLTRPEFARMATEWTDGWQELLAELKLSEYEVNSVGLDGAPSTLAHDPVRKEVPAPAEEALLRLSPFATHPRLRAEQVRLYRQDITLRRLKANEQLQEDEAVSNFEVINAPPPSGAARP